MGGFQISLLFLVACLFSATFGFTCKPAERNALLKFFKHSFDVFDDKRNCLSSWVGQDCCSWKGVGCDNVTGNVIKLDLWQDNRSNDLCYIEVREVNPSLLELKHLTYLDLSFVDFSVSRFPEFFGSMRQLQHLDLSFSSFSGKVPHVLGNLTQLVFLNLNHACEYNTCYMDNLEWASPLVNLQYLDLSGIDLSQAPDSLHILYKLPSLLDLSLNGCQLGNSHRVLTNLTVSSPTLHYLDLGGNLFSGSIPHFIPNMSSIRFLDLSFNQLSSSIPSWLADKTDLEYLSLGYNSFNHVDGGVMSIISRLCRLKRLDLSNNQLQEEVSESHVYNFSKCSRYDLEDLDMSDNKISGYVPIIGSLSSLRYLDLSYNHLENIPPSLGELSSLYDLSLSNNKLTIVPTVIGNLSFLDRLDLSNNYLEDLPPSLGALSSLSSLALSSNNLTVVPKVIGSLSSLDRLYLSYNGLEDLPASFEGLSSLFYLGLSNNHLSAVSPVIGSLSSLQALDLSDNSLETLPSSLGGLLSLVDLDLSNNNLSVVHQVSFAHLYNLRNLDMSSNPYLHFSHDWMPPFQLESFSILPCKLNSSFPEWLLSQERISELDLSDTGIFGPLPETIGIAMSSLQSLSLANNHINGSIPRSLCGLSGLNDLHLQNNRLSGIIPDCWWSSPIADMELSSNILAGPIPNSLTKASNLQLLRLNNNSIQGELPLSWSNSLTLELLDVSWNKLHGEIPPWNGANFLHLKILILRENRLGGIIPSQLCSVQTLHIINLANNNLVGTIPQCFGHFKAMGSMLHSSASIASPPCPSLPVSSAPTSASAESPETAFAAEPTPTDLSAQEVVKGQDREYTTVLEKLGNMDLSCNHLVGTIPTEITSLSLLHNLNFSHNHLSGIIPVEIGKMKALESLDLSSNNLSGSIPESMTSLDSLSNLNMSFNNLQGKIPTGRHFETLEDPSIYMNNPGLCGDPLPKKCFGDDNGGAHSPTVMVLGDEGDSKHEKMWFYLIIMLGFATGFWGVIGILVAHKKWRVAYFRIAEELADWIYVEVAVRIARANRGTRGV